MTEHVVFGRGVPEVRVLHAINSLSGSGGAEHGLVREVTHFDSGMDQLVVRLYASSQLEPRLDAAGIATTGLGLSSSRSGWNWLLGAFRLREVARQFSPDVVHSSLATANLSAQLATRRGRIPTLSTLTLSGDVTLVRSYQPGAAQWRAAIFRRVAATAARQGHVWFRALTEDAKSTSCDAMGIDPSRVEVIPRGVPMPDLSQAPPAREDLGLPADRHLVLNVGRQTAQKGHVDLISAFAKVRARLPAHLVILGREGDGTLQLREAIARHQLEASVTIVPYSSTPYDYYRVADVFAFPSFMEGLGTAVLEAMACRLPVVAYDIPPVREATLDGDLAVLVPIGDMSALADAVIACLDSPGRARETAARAHTHVVATHGLDSVASRMESLLHQVAGRTNSMNAG